MEILYYKILSLFDKRYAPYVLAGGKKGILKLVHRFYDLMDQDPAAKVVRDMHESDLTNSRQKLFMFLSGWFGGPNLYWKNYGHPRMRARHMKFAIGANERDQWLSCMERAVEEMMWPIEFKSYAMQSFRDFAHHMQNRKD